MPVPAVMSLAGLALASAAVTFWALRYANHRRLLDQPGERRSHSVPTPRGGGIGIAAALLVAAGAAALAGLVPAMQVLAFCTGLLLVAGVGWIDDHRSLSALPRLAVQCVAGMVLAWGCFGGGDSRLWFWLAAASVPVLVNVWNFMDGIDGLATTQALLAAIVLALLAPDAAGPLAWSLAAACCGFLPFNFPRARIFLGDVGSGTLGYALAAATMLAASSLAEADATPARGAAVLVLLPLSAFLLDASLTLAGRILRRERWWQPHVSHLYQRWVRSGRGHVFVTAVYALFSFVDGILALVLDRSAPGLAGGSTAAWLTLGAILWFLLIRATSTDRNVFAG